MDAPPGFERTKNGRYFHRYGPAYDPEGQVANVKLCIVASARAELVALLETLAARTDCFYLNLTVAPRGGMFMGRVFLSNRIAVGQAWAELKNHPRMFVTVQDDDFTRAYRG